MQVEACDPAKVAEPLRLVAHLLWTGGWDSTFRLLDLVLVQRRIVQPYYVIDHGRKSCPIEIATMNRIRDAATAAQPAIRHLFLPTKVFRREEILPDTGVTAHYERLRATAPLGPQYEWLCRLQRQLDVDGIEMAIHKDDRAHPHLVGYAIRDDDAYILAPAACNTSLVIFQGFRFPLLNLTKLDMRGAADTGGFSNLMDLTWFCHRPTRRCRPCGYCGPCVYAIEEGMSYRVPRQGRIMYAIHSRIGAARRGLPSPLKRVAKAALGRA